MCPEYQALVPRYAKGELPLYEVRQIEGHLEFCTSCRARAKLLEQEVLKSGWIRPIPDTVAAFARIREQVAVEMEGLAQESKKRPIWMPLAAGLLAAGAVILTLALVSFR